MTDQPDYSGHAMVALYPPEEFAARVALPDGLEPDDLHVTMVYLGRADDVDADAVQAAIRSLPSRDPFVAQVSGHGRFTGGDQDVVVALMDSPELERLRSDLLSALKEQGVEVPSEHGFTAHMTLTYLDADSPSPVDRLGAELVEFGSLVVKHGETKTVYPFGDSASDAVRPYARTAYAQGWAASGGPLTERVRAGCVAAMDLASAWCDHEEVLELALHLGHLEGVWAQVYARRDALMEKYTAQVLALWRQVIADLDVAGAVTLFRQQMGLSEAQDRSWVQRAKATARNAAIRLLQWLPGTTAWQALRGAVRALLAGSQAEGYAGAIAVAASEQSVLGFDFDIAFQHAYDALADLGEIWAEADGWLEKMLGRAADEFGRALGDLAAAGASYEDMVTAAMDVLGDTVTGRSIAGFIVDWAASTGLSQGALSLYRSEGVQQVTWMTAGDGRVCPICEANGEGSPWPITSFPTMPAHPLCRCVASAEFNISSAYSGFFS